MKQLDDKIRTECPLLGKRVIITGTTREDLNGQAGVATDFDHTKGRYVVTLNGKDGKVVKLKPEHVHEEVPVSTSGAAEEQGREDEAHDGKDEDDDWTAGMNHPPSSNQSNSKRKRKGKRGRR